MPQDIQTRPEELFVARRRWRLNRFVNFIADFVPRGRKTLAKLLLFFSPLHRVGGRGHGITGAREGNSASQLSTAGRISREHATRSLIWDSCGREFRVCFVVRGARRSIERVTPSPPIPLKPEGSHVTERRGKFHCCSSIGGENIDQPRRGSPLRGPPD